jgi:hypothetical protein
MLLLWQGQLAVERAPHSQGRLTRKTTRHFICHDAHSQYRQQPMIQLDLIGKNLLSPGQRKTLFSFGLQTHGDDRDICKQ